MNGIKDFIAVASKQLAEREDSTRQATGALLNSLQSTVAAGDFQQLLSLIPGAGDLIAPLPEPEGLGGAMGPMATELGGAGLPSGAVGLMTMMRKTDFAPAKVGNLIQMFMEHVRGKAGDSLATKLFSQLPELATLAV